MPYDPATCAFLESAERSNPNAVARLNGLPFEVRFGQAARSEMMVSTTGILQVNINNQNSRDVRRVQAQQQQQQMIQVQVPPNAFPGMRVQARIPDGRTIEVPIPAGAMPGHVISVAIPAQAPPPQMPMIGSPPRMPMGPQMPTMQHGPQMPTMPQQYARSQQPGGFVPRGPMPAPQPIGGGGGAVGALWTQLEMRDCQEIVGPALNEQGPAVFVEKPMDGTRRTIVHKACCFGRLETLKAIGAVLQPVGRAALCNFQDAAGKRGIDHAAERGHPHVVKWLLDHGAPVGMAQSLGAQHPAVAALFGGGAPPAPQGGAVNAARALASPAPDEPTNPVPDDELTAFLREWGLQQYEEGLRGIGVDDVRTLGTFGDHELKGIANEMGMNFGHGHKFADACKQVKEKTHDSPGMGDSATQQLLEKMKAIERQGQQRDQAIANVTQGLQHIDETQQDLAVGLHHIDETTTKTAQSVEQMKAMLGEVVAKTRGQTRLLADLCAGTTECPKLVWMARDDQTGIASWISPSAWYGKKVRIQFVCPVSMKVGTSAGFELTLPKDWMKKYGVALNVSLGVLRMAMQVGAAAMGCHHCEIADMSVDRARLKNADDLFNEVTKGLDKEQQDALEKGAPLGKQLAEASFQMLLRDIQNEHGENPDFGLVRVVCDKSPNEGVEWVHPDCVDAFREKGVSLLRPPNISRRRDMLYATPSNARGSSFSASNGLEVLLSGSGV